jgi:membrane protein DedA with SNARE-associated domain
MRGSGESSLTEQVIGHLGYLGIALVLVMGGLGVPIPEEVPIILASVLARNGKLWWPLALVSCLAGVLVGDFVVYCLGFFYGEKVLSWRLTRRYLTRQREAQIKGYFLRHGFKILVSGRFVPGFRSAAYLTAGILKLPALKLVVTDLVAASLSTIVMFGLGFAFAYQIQKGIREVQQWIILAAGIGVASWLIYRYYRARGRAGLPVGPPVSDTDEVPLPPLEPYPVPPAAQEPPRSGEPARHSALLSEALHDDLKVITDPAAASRGESKGAGVDDRLRLRTASSASTSDSVALHAEARPAQPTAASPSR